MVNRFFELILVTVLLVLTVGTVFQVLNHRLLRDIHDELRRAERVAAVRAPAPSPAAALRDSRPSAEPAAAAPPAVPAAVERPIEPSAISTAPPEVPAATVVVETAPAAPAQPAAAVPVATDPADGSAADAPEAAPVAEAGEPETAAAAPQGEPAPDKSATDGGEWEEHREQIHGFVRQLYRGEYQSVARHFTADLAENFPVELLSKAMEDAKSRHGDFEEFEKGWLDREVQTAELMPFRLPVRTTSGQRLQFTFWLTEAQKIKGLSFRLLED